MAEVLRSLGLDVGTTSTQMVLSELTVENRAGSFAVPEMEIADRKILYKSPVHLTPLIREELVDAEKIREILDGEYRNAGITRDRVDTGAVIITGETGRKENARAVLEAISAYAGDFVVATAGPDLESVLAARGSGAVSWSEKTGKSVLHMDIGGGTANFARIEAGRIAATGCMNVGGRLLKIEPDGRLDYVSPVLEGLFHKRTGDYVNREEVAGLARTLTCALEMAAGLREWTGLADSLVTAGTARPVRGLVPGEGKDLVISFSGGVADCIKEEKPWLCYGDMGPELGAAIRESLLCQGDFILGRETIRATVIGAGCHSAQLSGSTVFCQNVALPLKNLQVVERLEDLPALDGPGVVAMEGISAPDYEAVAELAEKIRKGHSGELLILALQQDMAKALGQQLALKMGTNARILCLDRVKLKPGDYLDVGAAVGSAYPIVVKTLVLGG